MRRKAMRLALVLCLALIAAACGRQAQTPPAVSSAEQAAPAPVAGAAPALAAPVIEAAASVPAAKSAAPPAPAPPVWTVDPARSAIVVEGFMNKTQKPQSGAFGKWTAQIKFDPKDLPHSKVSVTISTASFRTGNTFYDGVLPDADWLSQDKFPTASFTASTFTGLGGGKYQAKGVLTVKGASFPVTLPFTLTINGVAADMKGALPLDLDTLAMGKENDPGREYAAKAVTVNVTVHATRS
jgi:cytochrome b561